MTSVTINTQTVNIYTASSSSSPPAIPENKQVEEKKEIWKSIPGFPAQYQASNKGRVRDGMLRIRKFTEDELGYKKVSIKNVKYQIADLVGNAFIPKPQNDKPMTIDHIDFDPGNNHVENLRWATANQQAAHQRKRKNTKKPLTSKYKGVSFKKTLDRWKSEVTVDNKVVYCELFDHELDAVAAYDRKAKEFQGEFAVLNNIEETEEYQNFIKNKKWRKEGHRYSGTRYYGVRHNMGKIEVNIRDPRVNKMVYHGRFVSEKAAARKANEELIKIHGPTYRRLNVISSDEEEEEDEEEGEQSSSKRIKYNEVEEEEELEESEISEV